MPPRRKSIFHLGDDDDGEAAKTTTSATASCCLVKEVKCMKSAAEDAVEGLRILIHHREHEGAASVVIKATMKTCRQLHAHHHHHRHRLPRVFPVIDFLKRCCFCTRELNPCKDVYMYRGDQGFCSMECRNRQILMDERREFEMAMRNRLNTAAAHQQHGRLRSKFDRISDRNRRIPAVLA